MRATLLASASAIVLLSMSAAVQAQDDAGDEAESLDTDRETILVTATRREQSIQDVPLSITALGQDELTSKGIVGYEGLAQQVPGVTLNKPTANFNNFTARGIATNGYGANLQSTVAIYIDELPISANGNSTILDPNLFDVERVEFLRGPQGTLFGSGSLAGAVRILTKSPDLDEYDYSGVVDFGLTDGDAFRQRYNGMVNIPLVEDKLGLRVVGFYRHEEGWVDNIGTGVENSNTLEDWGGRAILLYEPTDRLSVRLLASYEKSTPEDSSLVNPDLDDDRRTRRSDRPDLFVGELANYNATISYDFDGFDLTSSTTYTHYDALFYVDLAGTFAQSIAFALDADAYDDIFVEEVRLVSDPGGKWDWVVGGFYFYKRRDVDFNYRSRQDFLDARGITGLPDEYYSRSTSYSVAHELAGFGELTYNFSDDFWVTGGLRYGKTDVQGFTEPGGYTSNYLVNALFGIPGPLTITDIEPATGEKAEESGFSYKASASYRLNDDVTTYATYSTGFRTPVVNARAGLASTLDPNDIIIPYGASSDDLKSYEVGMKGVWDDGRLTANLAAYYIDWSNIQVQANRVSDSVQFATNIGEAVSKGFEFEFTYVPFPDLFISMNGAYNDAEVTNLTAAEAAISGAVEGARLSSPRFQGAARIQYGFDIWSGYRGYLAGSIAHVGSYPGMFPNVPGDPSSIQPTYDFTEAFQNVTVHLGADFGELNATLYVENLLDDDSFTYVHPEVFVDGRYATQRPRTFGIRLSHGI